MDPVILASQSPRRKQLLEWAEIDFEVLSPGTDESYPAGLPMEEIPIYIARQKARRAQEIKGTDRLVIGADTVVVLDGEIIGKPRDRDEALAILKRLSGREHQVITGVVLIKEEKEISFSDATDVWFHTLHPSQIEFYVDKYQPYDKAGAYAIQEWIGVVGIRSIRGDFYNVMGFPISRVVQELNTWQ